MGLILVIIFFLLYFNYIGIFICDIFNEQLYWVRLKFPIGLITIFGFFQFISFPLLYFHVPMKVEIICLVIILLLFFIGATIHLFVKNKKRLFIFKMIKNNLFLIILTISFVGLHLFLTFITNSLNITSSDQSFYITLVKNNINAEQINTIYPLTGEIKNLHLFYNFQGLFVMLSGISQLFNIESLAIVAWLYPVLLLTFLATTIINICSYCGVKRRRMFFAFLIAVFMLNFWNIEAVVKYNTYNGPLRAYIFAYIFILYYEGFKTNKFNQWIINLVWLAAIAVQSTTLFNGYLLLGSFILYDLFISKKKLFFDLITSGSSLHIYLFFFLRYSSHYKISSLWVLFMILMLIIRRHDKYKEILQNIIYHKNMKKIIVLGYCSMIGISLIIFNYGWLEPSISSEYFIEYLNEYYFNTSYYSSIFFSLLNTILKILFIFLNLYVISKMSSLKEWLRFFVITELILIILWYNPIASPFISTFITGNVYFRLRDIIFNIPLIVALLYYMVYRLRYGKVFFIFLILCTAGLGCINIYEYLSYGPNQIEDFSQHSFYYRLPQNTVHMSQFLNQYLEKYDSHINPRPRIYSMDRTVNYFSNKYEMIYTANNERNFNSIDLEQKIRFEFDPYVLEGLVTQCESYQEYLIKYRLLLKVYRVDFVVLNNNVSELIKQETLKDYHLIYVDSSYSVYEQKNN